MYHRGSDPKSPVLVMSVGAKRLNAMHHPRLVRSLVRIVVALICGACSVVFLRSVDLAKATLKSWLTASTPSRASWPVRELMLI
jgi:hypothetical protein